MGRLANVSGKQAVKALVRTGYNHTHTSGDHAILKKPNSPTLSIPLHKEVSPYLLKTQLKRAGLTIEGFRKLLK